MGPGLPLKAVCAARDIPNNESEIAFNMFVI